MDPRQLLLQIAMGAASAAGGLIATKVLRALWPIFNIGAAPDDQSQPAADAVPGLKRPLTASESRAVLEAWGQLSPRHVWAIVNRAVPGKTPTDERTREELAATLLNLTRGARIVSSQETASSYVLRRSEVVAKMAAMLGTKRRPGERITGQEDWQLRRFLGMGTFGEVWLGRNRQSGMLRAFKFFPQPDAGLGVRR